MFREVFAINKLGSLDEAAPKSPEFVLLYRDNRSDNIDSHNDNVNNNLLLTKQGKRETNA